VQVKPGSRLDNKGYSTVELVLVLLLLLLFGVTTFTLIFAGSDTYQRISDNKNAETDARIALSYLNVKIRQNDMAGKIEVKNFPGTGKPALVLHDTRPESDLITWIFWERGMLLECLISEGEIPSSDLSFLIVEVDDFTVSYDEETRMLTGTVSYEYDGRVIDRSCKVYLRSNPETAGEGALVGASGALVGGALVVGVLGASGDNAEVVKAAGVTKALGGVAGAVVAGGGERV
jgi:hypothetical protein